MRNKPLEGRVLLVTQEMQPYLEESIIGTVVRDLLSQLKQHHYEARVMMPRFGKINDKKHRLHEVVRLSGINISIGDEDYSLLIKVATLPEVRMQVYFMDNEELFSTPDVFRDSEGRFLPTNGLRMTFFARSIVEVMLKLGWEPDIIHFHGWFTSLVPMFIRRIAPNAPMFRKARLVMSIYDDYFPEKVNDQFPEIARVDESITDEDLEKYRPGTYTALYSAAAQYADALILGSEYIEPDLVEQIERHAQETGKPLMRFDGDLRTFVENHIDFYRRLQHHEEVETLGR